MLSILKLKVAKKFFIYLNLFYLVALFIPTILIFYEFENLLYDQVRKQAESIYQQIVITRKWIADHGGIYVEKLPWVEPNPYLAQVGEKPFTISKEGKILVKEDPALVTRQLSEYSKRNYLYWFKITSLKFINPLNKPDTTEERALLEFEKQKVSHYETIEYIGNNQVFRFIKPLIIEESCLKCHAKQGYKPGNVRGAISIFIPIDQTLEKISEYKKMMIFIFISVFLLLNGIIYFLSKKFIFSPLLCVVSILNTLKKLSYPKISTNDKKESEILLIENEWQLIIKGINNFIETINKYETKLEEEIRQATKELEIKNKELERLIEKKSFILCNMAHEIKTPLTSLKGSIDYLNLLLDKNVEILPEDVKERTKEFLDVAKRNCERLIHLLTTLVELEKAEAKLLELEISEFSVLEVVEECLLLVEGLMKDKNIQIQVEVPEQLFIKADREKIITTLLNLLDNAIKHSPVNGKITIKAEETSVDGKREIVFEVWDEGEGLKVDVDKLFEKFYKGKTEGYGLGLAIAKAYVSAHGGKIWAKNREKGAIFYFSIPQDKIEA
jgi:signal transduction histidine kinase